MVYSDSQSGSPGGFRPSRDISLDLFHLLHMRLPTELAIIILNLSEHYSRSWCRRLKATPSKVVNNHLEFFRNVRVYLETPPFGPRQLRAVEVAVCLSNWKATWPQATCPSILRASLIRPAVDGRNILLAHESVEPPIKGSATSFTVTWGPDTQLVSKARLGDRLRISLLPHLQARSGISPVVKEVTVYMFWDW